MTTREPQGAQTTGHEYDGIVEYTNPMPSWWTNIFWLTIAFSIVYVAVVHFSILNLGVKDEYWAEEKIVRAKRAEDALKQAVSEQVLAVALADPGSLASGKEVYGTRCVTCHKEDGSGLIGPNLTDKQWIHGDGTLMGIYNVVNEGVPAKGMLAWGRILSPVELRQVVAYVGSLRGTNKEGKAPEGNVVP